METNGAVYFHSGMLAWNPSSLPCDVQAMVTPNSTALYDASTLYWLGSFGHLQSQLFSLPIFFLTLERCVVVARIGHDNSRIIKWLGLCDITVTGVTPVLCVVAYLRELPLSLDKVAKCQTFSCTSIKPNPLR